MTQIRQEISEGKLLIDAAKAAGAKGIIWSGLVPVKQISGGKYSKVLHFDSKAQVADYGRASSVPFVDVQAGFYASNFVGPFPLLAKQPDGTYALPWAARPSTVVPVIDIEHDYGLFVRRALEAPVFPDGQTVYTTSEDISVEDMARQIAESTRRGSLANRYSPLFAVTSQKVVFKQITPEDAAQKFIADGFPPAAATDAVEGFLFMDEFGCAWSSWIVSQTLLLIGCNYQPDYGGKPSASSEGLARPTRTFAEFVKSADWSKVIV
jgi:hypothetical protein